MIARLRWKLVSGYGLRRHRLEQSRNRIVRAVLFWAWRYFGERAYEFHQALQRHDARHPSAKPDDEYIEDTRRPPAVFCESCGQEISP